METGLTQNQNPVHTYSSTGTHTVKPIVSNENRTASKTANVLVLNASSSTEISSRNEKYCGGGAVLTKNTGTPEKESKITPGFEIVCGTASLLASFRIKESNKK